MGDINKPTVMKEILDLYGCDAFKEYCRKLRLISRNDASKSFIPPYMLVSIDQGAGFSTIAGKYIRLLKELEYLPGSCSDNPVEHALSKGNEKMNGSGSTMSMLENSSHVMYAIDISDWLGNRLYDPYVKKVLRFIWKMRRENPSVGFIFKMPNVEQFVIDRVRDVFESILNVEIIRIDPPEKEEMSLYVQMGLKKYLDRESLDSKTVSLINSIIINKMGGGKFFYYSAMSNLLREISFMAAINSSNGQDITYTLSQMLPEGSKSHKSGRDRLDELIGLENIKNSIDEITASILFNKERNRQKGVHNKRPNLHMIFSGAPGTGKTVVARVIGKIFKEQGILETGDLLEVTRKDLVGEYIGQTALKTASVCKAALGNVLFIDEAYALVNDTTDRRDFGFEAVSTLVTELENHRGEFVCIMAGYEEDMERLFELNPGLRSRFAYKIDYSNYSREELGLIYFFQIKDQCLYDEKFEEYVMNFFKNIDKAVFEGKNFANARFVRNIAERSIAKAYVRLSKTKERPVDNKIRLSTSDFDEAIASKDIKQTLGEKNKRPIGFLPSRS